MLERLLALLAMPAAMFHSARFAGSRRSASVRPLRLALLVATTAIACSIDERPTSVVSGAAGAAGGSSAAGSGGSDPTGGAGTSGSGGSPGSLVGNGGRAGGADDLGQGGSGVTAGTGPGAAADAGPDAAQPEPEPELPSCADQLLPASGTALATTTAAPGRVTLSCGPGNSDDVSFYWVAPADGYYSFDTFGSSFDTALGLLSPSCDGSELECNDDATGAAPSSEIVRQLSAGEGLIIAVDGKSGSFGDVVVNAQPVLCPAIDLGLQALPIESTTLDGTNVHDGACGGAGALEKSYRWQAPEAGLYRFSVSSEDFDPALYVERGPRCGGTLLGCNAGGVRSPATVVRRLDAGEVVTLIVDATTGSGSFGLNVENVSSSTCPSRGTLVDTASGVLSPGAPSVLTGSCEAAHQSVLPGGDYDLPDDTFALTVNAGLSCSLILTADGPAAVYVLDGLTCGGAELSCQDVPESADGVLIDVDLGDLFTGPFEYTVGVEATSPVSGDVTYTLDLICAII